MRKFLILAALIVVVSGITFAQKSAPFSTAERISEEDAEITRWKIATAAAQYEIDQTGLGKRTTPDGKSSGFLVTLDKNDELYRVIYFKPVGDDLVIASENNGGDSGASFITRLNSETLKPAWRLRVPGFNIAEILSEGNFAYVGAIGFAGKVDLATGKFVWKHEDFYRKYKKDGAFNIFELPEIEGDEVIFKELITNRAEPNVIRFNKNTGKVIKVTVH